MSTNVDFADDNFVIEAAWLFSGKSEPVPNVAIEVTDGVISDIRSVRQTKSRHVIIPPIVNAHTHLELSDCRSPIPRGETFPDWIRKVIAHRATRGEPDNALALGIREITGSSTSLVADTVPMGQPLAAETPFERVSFVEYIGLTDDRIDAATEHAKTTFGPGTETKSQLGISPHAPYSVRPDLLDKLIDIARAASVPVMMHLGETREELELLEHGSGPFADMLKAFGIWEPGLFPKLSLCDYIDRVCQAPRALFAHGNYFGQKELDLLAARPNATVVFCPRTHQHFGHSPHPWQKMIDRGINVALGTDSRASNPDLSVWNEAVALVHEAEGRSGERLLRMLTANDCLKLAEAPGEMSPGNAASFTLMERRKSSGSGWNLLWSSQPVSTCSSGRWLRSAPGEH